MLRHLAERAIRGRIIGRVDTVKVGKKERRFVSPNLGKSSLGLSGQFVLVFVNVGWGSAKNTAVRDSQ